MGGGEGEGEGREKEREREGEGEGERKRERDREREGPAGFFKLKQAGVKQSLGGVCVYVCVCLSVWE